MGYTIQGRDEYLRDHLQEFAHDNLRGIQPVLIYPSRISLMSEKLIICIIFLFGHVLLLLLVETVYFDLYRNS